MMLKFVRAVVLVVALLSGCNLSAATSGGLVPLFSSGAGNRALGMGGANVALANDPSAVFWNPAALTALPGRSLSLMYLPLPEGTNYSFAAVGWPTVDYGSFSLGVFLLSTDQIERRDGSGRLLGEFSAGQQMYLVGYGKQFNRYLAFGATLKLFGESFDNVSSFGGGGDLGVKLNLSDHLMLGLNAQNILAPKIRLDRDSEKLPMNLKAGGGVVIPFSDNRNRLSIEVDVDKTDDVDPAFHVGAEVAFMGNYFLRGGYDVDQVNLGAGLHLGPATFGYTFRTQDFFQAQHRISLDLSFGGSIESILAKREQDKLRSAQELAGEQRKNDLDFARTQAGKFYQNGNYDSAEVYFQRVSVLTNGVDQEANQRLQEIGKQRSDRLTATVRAGVLAESDSLKAEQLFAELTDAINVKDAESSSLLLSRLRPAFGSDKRFSERERGYQGLISERIAMLQRDGSRLSNEGRLAEAALCYDQILNLNAGDATAKHSLRTLNDRITSLSLLRSGIAAFNLGDTALARENIEKVLATTPSDTVALGLLKLIHSESPALSSSLAEIQKNPDVWKTYLEGIEFFRQGDYEQAIKRWEQVLVSFPGQTETEKNIQQAKLRLQPSGKIN